ncbi:MAG: CDP-diacylglycerol--glycerol-3-phosphate 3-phosphatidyltransferase [Clostridiales bacterium]|nr:MAG: CDP-diacylglycerol--glycerol-3-phosphate 3-phosphatidyltransferase [Clostridiales bacterium]
MKNLNLPNKITLARIALIPIVAILYFVNFPYHEIAACIVFILCCCTDFIDGNIARKRNLVTDLGKFLDPIADKVIVVIMLFVFVGDGTLPGWYNQIIAGVIISREIIITAFRIIAVQKNVVLAADKLGKIKTTFLDIGLIALTMSTIQTGEIAGKAFYFFDWLGQITYYIGAFFAIVSGVNYVLKKTSRCLPIKKARRNGFARKKTLSETEKEKNDVEEVVHND